MPLPQLLDKFGLNLDDLNAAERDTYFEWMERLSRQEMTLDDVKAYVPRLIASLNAEMASLEPPPSVWAWLMRDRRETYLKARLRNYLMLADFLAGPERAQKWVERQLSTIKPTK